MRRRFVAGNWKMHGSQAQVEQLCKGLLAASAQFVSEVAVMPSFIYLPQVAQLLAGSPIAWGGQNCAMMDNGALTGEISARMLTEFGSQYVIIGHSERRHLLGEAEEAILAKLQTAQTFGVIPILCVGETQAERDAGQTQHVIATQLATVLQADNKLELLAQLVIAYEPVWAIGTGQTASPADAQSVHAFIREQISQLDATLASACRILYGGSVKPNNAQALFAMPDIDGGLIGGASLNVNDFVEICQCNN